MMPALPLLLLAVVTVVLFLLWPRFRERQTNEGAATPAEAAPPVAVLPDTAAPAEVPEVADPARGDTALVTTPPADPAQSDSAAPASTRTSAHAR